MADGWLNLVVCGLLMLGLSAVALSQVRHWLRVMGEEAFPGTRALRRTAMLLLLSALLFSQATQGFAMGTVFWCLATVPCGLGVTLLLCWRSGWLRWLGNLFTQ